MALENFKPTLWASRLLKQLDENYVLVALCNRDYEGQISGKGDTVKISSIGDISVNDYSSTTTVSFEQLEDAQTKLEIDQSKYFAFEIDDIDQAQQKPKVMGKAMQKSAQAVADVADSYIAGLYGDAGITPPEEDWNSDLSISDAVKKIRQNLWENNVPRNARIWWTVNPEIYHMGLSDLVADLSDNVDEIKNGNVGSVYGIDLHVTNQLTGDGSESDPYQTMAGTSAAMSYAEQINKTEAYRPEDSFSDAVKGLHLYGAKVTRPEQLVNLPVQTSS